MPETFQYIGRDGIPALVDPAGSSLQPGRSRLPVALVDEDFNPLALGAAGLVDDSPFTFGTSEVAPIGGVGQSGVPTDSVDAGDIGALAMTLPRGLHVNLRDSSGAEAGVAANPTRVRPEHVPARTMVWSYDTGTGGNPSAGRFQASAASDPSTLYFHLTAQGSVDATEALLALRPGDRVFIQDQGSGARYWQFMVDGRVSETSSVVSVPVHEADKGTSISNGTDCWVTLRHEVVVQQVEGAALITGSFPTISTLIAFKDSSELTDPQTAVSDARPLPVTDVNLPSFLQEGDVYDYNPVGGATEGYAVFGVYDADKSDTLADGRAGAARLTAHRAWHASLRDESGDAIGVSGNPLSAEHAAASAAYSPSAGIDATTLSSATYTAAVTGGGTFRHVMVWYTGDQPIEISFDGGVTVHYRMTAGALPVPFDDLRLEEASGTVHVRRESATPTRGRLYITALRAA